MCKYGYLLVNNMVDNFIVYGAYFDLHKLLKDYKYVEENEHYSDSVKIIELHIDELSG